uniref:Molecular chaperone DnaJ n=1 Tax=Zygnema circumcarinatum TaxID=35869 RepID=A0A6N0GXI9_ZYGCR|nr:molecular chaperone DnaJ [Zygnema circumcarinatum]
MKDIFALFSDIFISGRGPFESFFRQAQQTTRKGTDLRITLKLSLKEVANGVDKKIKIKRYAKRDRCGGNGAKDRTAIPTCSICKGTAQTKKIANTILGKVMATIFCNACYAEGNTI